MKDIKWSQTEIGRKKKGVIDWQTPDNQIKSFIKEERYKGYEEGRDDGFKEGKNAALSEVKAIIKQQYTHGCSPTDIVEMVSLYINKHE